MKLLIVDDDDQIREGIQEGIDWKSLKIDEVRGCGDGLTALELCRDFSPHIVLADVRMPRMDGLTFLREVKLLNPDTKVIMISGYSDFAYLKSALVYGAEDYELKPIKMRKLIELIQKTRDKIMAEQCSKKKVAAYHQMYDKNFLPEAVRGDIKDKMKIQEYLKDKLKDTKEILMICCVLEIDVCRRIQEKDRTAKEELETFLQYYVNNHQGSLYSPIAENRFVLLETTISSSIYIFNKQNEFKHLFTEYNSAETETNFTVSVGITTAFRFGELAEAYRVGTELLKNKFYLGRGAVILQMNHRKERDTSVKNMGAEREAQNKKYLELREKMEDSIFCGDMAAFNCCLESLGSSAQEGRLTERKKIENFFIGSCSRINEKCIRNRADKKFEIKELIKRLEGLSFLEDYLSEMRNFVMKALEIQNKAKYSITINRCIEYIHGHYREALSTELLAVYIGKTPNYFSHLFKKEVKISFKEYVNIVRMDKAKELLEQTGAQIYEVAESVGFNDYMYFSQVFKKTYGITPTDVRKSRC